MYNYTKLNCFICNKHTKNFIIILKQFVRCCDCNTFYKMIGKQTSISSEIRYATKEEKEKLIIHCLGE